MKLNKVDRNSMPQRKGKCMSQTVLIVEDDTIFHGLYGRMLRYSSTQVDFVATLSEALEKLESTQYDAVITDLRLTASDHNEGLLVIDHIVNHTPDCPIVLTTGADAIIAARDVQSLPNIWILLKPFNRQDFKELLSGIGIAIDDQRTGYLRPRVSDANSSDLPQ